MIKLDIISWLQALFGKEIAKGLKKIIAYILRFEYKSPYYAPHQIAYFNYGPLDEEGNIFLKTRKITTITVLKNGDISIEYPFYSRGEIKQSFSFSHPLDMELKKEPDAQTRGKHAIKINKVENGQTFMIATETKRKINLENKIRDENFRKDFVRRTLYSEVLDRGVYYDAVGTRAFCNTNYLKIIVEFDESIYPDDIQEINIGEKGGICQHLSDAPKITSTDGLRRNQVYISEIKNPEVNSGFYLYWKWPLGND